MSLNPDKYVTKIDSSNYSVDIDLLREETAAMIQEHAPVYIELVAKNKEGIDQYKSPSI